MEELIDRIISNLTEEIGKENIPFPNKLEQKVNSAVLEVKRARRYPKEYTDEMILKDIEMYESSISRIALYDFNQIGAEGETMHIENNTQRMWKDRSTLFKGITPISKIV